MNIILIRSAGDFISRNFSIILPACASASRIAFSVEAMLAGRCIFSFICPSQPTIGNEAKINKNESPQKTGGDGFLKPIYSIGFLSDKYANTNDGAKKIAIEDITCKAFAGFNIFGSATSMEMIARGGILYIFET